MATLRTVTVRASGGDYTSLNAAEAGEQGDITAATGSDEQVDFDCGDFSDTTNVVFLGWTTAAANYIRVFTQSGNRHNGTAREVSGSGYEITSASNVILVQEDFMRFEGLVIRASATGGNAAIQAATIGAGSDIRFEKCIFHDKRTTAGTTSLVAASTANLNVRFRTCISYGKQRWIDTRAAASALIEQCVFFTDAAALGIIADSDTTTTGSYAGGTSSEDFWTAGSPPSGSHNISSDASATVDYTDSHINKAPSDQFVSAANDNTADFHLKSTAFLRGESVAISGLTEDIDGDAWESPPSVGADEFVAVGGARPQGPFGHPFHGPFAGPIG